MFRWNKDDISEYIYAAILRSGGFFKIPTVITQQFWILSEVLRLFIEKVKLDIIYKSIYHNKSKLDIIYPFIYKYLFVSVDTSSSLYI